MRDDALRLVGETLYQTFRQRQPSSLLFIPHDMNGESAGSVSVPSLAIHLLDT
jgi:hypothetical protein